MATSRIIVTGKNRDFPKTVFMPLGVAVDGATIGRRIQIAADEEKCKRCAGWGDIEVSDNNPSTRPHSERCPACEGNGIVKMAGALNG